MIQTIFQTDLEPSRIPPRLVLMSPTLKGALYPP